MHQANKEKILVEQEYANEKQNCLVKADSSRNLCMNILEQEYLTKVQKMDDQRL